MRRVVKDEFSYLLLILQRKIDKTVLNLRGPGYFIFIFWTFSLSHAVGCWCYFDPCISSWSNFSSIIPNGAFRPQFSEGSLSICRCYCRCWSSVVVESISWHESWLVITYYIHTSVQLGELWTVLNASLIQQDRLLTVARAHEGKFMDPHVIKLAWLKNWAMLIHQVQGISFHACR